MKPPSPAPRRRRGCLGCALRGCLGCATVLVLILVLGAAASWFLRPGPEDRQTSSVMPESGRWGAGRVILELEGGTFRIEPAAPGEGPSAETTADVSTASLEHDFERKDDGTWSWHLRSESRGLIGRLWSGPRQAPEITVRLPPDTPLDLELRLVRGASRAELGGLNLTRLVAHLSKGDHHLAFSSPLRAPLEELIVDASFGSTRVDGLGHASPVLTRVESSFGEMRLGLGGPWQRSGTMSVEFRMGTVTIEAPPELRLAHGDISVQPGDVSLPPLPEPGESGESGPEIRLDVQGRFGELRLGRSQD